MQGLKGRESYFSDICIEKCGGLCCDPWWGIISFPLVRHGATTGLRAELVKAIKARCNRIIESYVTNESPKRHLFKSPYRLNVKLRGIKAEGSELSLEILAMFAFRCLFFSDKRACAIHPSVLGGVDIRPPHCARLGVSDATPGEKGYCRVIYAAGSGEEEAHKAIEVEKQTALTHLKEGFDTAEEAADSLMAEINGYLTTRAPHLMAETRPVAPGRNDPCWCSSGRKYKKCHGA